MSRQSKPINELNDAQHDFDTATSRRRFLLLGLGGFGMLLTGCASQQSTTTAATGVPSPVWRPRDPAPRPMQQPHVPTPATPQPATPTAGNVLPRSQWATARPVPSRMNHMTPINAITVHHDGMSAFYETDERSTINRLESIRRFHRDNRGWGDIGYHYIVDRSGRVWEGRAIGFQGAHVANHNEGNIGVLLLGNFDQQTPSTRQLEALNHHVSLLMRSYRVPLNRVATHREWDGARTACPGATLQSHMDTVRRRGWLG